MIDYAISGITLQQIQVFHTVAQTLNFTTAAEMLNLTQPGISKSITTLEQILGFQLFVRTSRSVSLTEEGAFLYKQWNHILEKIDDDYKQALALYKKNNSQLKIGLANTTESQTYFWDIASLYKRDHPQTILNVEAEDMHSLQNSLAEDLYDLIFIPDFERHNLDKKTTQWKYAALDNVQVILPLSNPLANKDILEFDDIRDIPISTLDPAINPNFLKDVRALYRKYDAEPIIGATYQSNFQIQHAQIMSATIHITDNFWECHMDKFSRKLPLKDEKNGLICVWKKVNKKPELEAFLKVIGNVK